MIVDKDYRITLPKNTFTSFSADDFVKVTISKGNLNSSFYLRVPKKCPSRKSYSERTVRFDNDLGGFRVDGNGIVVIGRALSRGVSVSPRSGRAKK